MSDVGIVDFVIEQGRTWEKSTQWLRDGVPMDLAGCTALMQVREDTPTQALLIELSTANSLIAINPAQGLVHFMLPAAVTRTFPVPTGTGFPDRRGWIHDCQITDSIGRIIPYIRGRWIVVGAVTRS